MKKNATLTAKQRLKIYKLAVKDLESKGYNNGICYAVIRRLPKVYTHVFTNWDELITQYFPEIALCRPENFRSMIWWFPIPVTGTNNGALQRLIFMDLVIAITPKK